MFEKLEDYLKKWVDELRASVYLDALDSLSKIGFDNAWQEISLILDSEEDIPLSILLDDITTIIIVGLDAVLASHGIAVDGEIPIKTKILDGIITLQDFDDSYMITAIIEDSDDPVYVFSNLLDLVSEHSAEYYHPHLVSVSSGFIRQVKFLYNKELENEEAVVFDNNNIQKQTLIALYCEKYPNCLLKTEIVDELRPIGTPFENLIQSHRLALSLYEPKGVDIAAMEIVGLSLLSDITLSDFKKKTKELPELVYTDMTFIANLDSALDKYIDEILRHEQTTVHA